MALTLELAFYPLIDVTAVIHKVSLIYGTNISFQYSPGSNPIGVLVIMFMTCAQIVPLSLE